MRWIVSLAALAWSLTGAAAPVSFAWNAQPDYPAGVTYEFAANECALTGLTDATVTCDLSGAPGSPLHAQVRAVAAGYEPSPWATLDTVIPGAGAVVPLPFVNVHAWREVVGGGAMTAPTYQSINATTWTAGAPTKSTSSHSPASGQTLVLLGASEDANAAISSLSTSGPATTQHQISNTLNYSPLAIYTATATGGSITESITRSGDANQFAAGLAAIAYSGSDGVGASNRANGATGNPSVSLTTTQDNSAVVVIVTDWAAISAGTPAISGYTYMSAQSYNGDATTYGVYIFRADDVGTAGAKTVTMTGKSATKWQIAAVEIKGTAGGGGSTVSGAGASTGTAMAGVAGGGTAAQGAASVSFAPVAAGGLGIHERTGTGLGLAVGSIARQAVFLASAASIAPAFGGGAGASIASGTAYGAGTALPMAGGASIHAQPGAAWALSFSLGSQSSINIHSGAGASAGSASSRAGGAATAVGLGAATGYAAPVGMAASTVNLAGASFSGAASPGSFSALVSRTGDGAAAALALPAAPGCSTAAAAGAAGSVGPAPASGASTQRQPGVSTAVEIGRVIGGLLAQRPGISASVAPAVAMGSATLAQAAAGASFSGAWSAADRDYIIIPPSGRWTITRRRLPARVSDDHWHINIPRIWR